MVSVYKREGSPNWYARLRDPRKPDGEDRRSTGKSTRREAEEAARNLQEQIDFELTSSDGIRWIDASEDFIRRATLKPKTIAGYVSLISVVSKSCLGDFNLKVLTHDDIRRFIKQRRESQVVAYNRKAKAVKPVRKPRHVSDASIRRALSLISSVIDWTIEQELHGAPAENIMRTFDRSKLKESKPLDRHLRPSQFLRIMETIKNEEHQRIIMVLVGTGMRTSELLTLTWDEVDFANRNIEFGNLDPDKTKNSHARRIPMTSEVFDALTAQRTAQGILAKRRPKFKDTRYVFPSRVSAGPRSHLGYLTKRVKALTGLKSYRTHDLRHTFGSWALQQRMDLIAVATVMGHSDVSTTSRYARHVNDSIAAQFRELRVPTPAQQPAQSNGLEEQK